MNLTFQEQLSTLPIPRLTTVVRVNFLLIENAQSFKKVASLIESWWNQKATPYGVKLTSEMSEFAFSQGRFKAELARSERLYAFSMEEPDSAVESRDWLCDFALRTQAGQTEFALRVSYRQPHNQLARPSHRAPRFLRDIVENVGAVDCRRMESVPREIGIDDLEFFKDLIQAPQRSLPVVAISEESITRKLFADPGKLAKLLAGAAHVLRLDEEASWQLTRSWGPDWSIYQGAVRCYNPSFQRTGDKFKHRIWLPPAIQRMDAGMRDGFLNACSGHVFTQVTAQFEPLSMLTPAAVRRLIESERERQSHERSKEASAPPNERAEVQTKVQPVEIVEIEKSKLYLDAVSKNASLEERLRTAEERLQRLEEAIEQERTGRAESERSRSEAEENYTLVKEEYDELNARYRTVMGDDNMEASENLRPLWASFNSFFTAVSNVASQFRRMETESAENASLNETLRTASQMISNQHARIESLERREILDPASASPTSGVERDALLKALPTVAGKNPTLEGSLAVVSSVFPDRVTVLGSAFQSAASSNTFRHGDQAFKLLWSLATDYWDTIRNLGDTEARKVFGTSYAPRESSKLSKSGQEKRTFVYRGKQVIMEKHLKIGVADNASDTLRVHFEWFGDEERIVIGHCGRHLDF